MNEDIQSYDNLDDLTRDIDSRMCGCLHFI